MPDAGRVITGSAGGRRLVAPGEGTRPLAAKVKQALFSILGAAHPRAWQVPALDLFAGSGAAGIEALSRGAPAALFVERDGRAARVIAANLERTGLGARGRVARREVAAVLAAGAAGVPEAPFGIVIVDPPYEAADAVRSTLERLTDPALGWLADDAVVAAKHFWRDAPPDTVGGLAVLRRRRFGETALSVYRRGPHPTAGGNP